GPQLDTAGALDERPPRPPTDATAPHHRFAPARAPASARSQRLDHPRLPAGPESGMVARVAEPGAAARGSSRVAGADRLRRPRDRLCATYGPWGVLDGAVLSGRALRRAAAELPLVQSLSARGQPRELGSGAARVRPRGVRLRASDGDERLGLELLYGMV